MKEPMYWDSIFTCTVLDAYDRKELTRNNIKEWVDRQAGPLGTDKAVERMLDYYEAGHDIRKQRGMIS